MAKRKIAKTPQDEIYYGIPCRHCGISKAKYSGKYVTTLYTSWDFICRNCGKLTIRIYSNKELKEIDYHATNG